MLWRNMQIDVREWINRNGKPAFLQEAQGALTHSTARWESQLCPTCGQQPENPETKPKHMVSKAQKQFAYEGSLFSPTNLDFWGNIQD